MNLKNEQAKQRSWKDRLPLNGYKWKIVLKDGRTITSPWAILRTDGRYLHVENLKKDHRLSAYPIIDTVDPVPTEKILKIFYREEERGEEYCLL